MKEVLLESEKKNEQKHLWVSILGMPSTGKTILGEELSRRLGARFIQNTYILKREDDWPDAFKSIVKKEPLVTEATHNNIYINAVNDLSWGRRGGVYIKEHLFSKKKIENVTQPNVLFYLRPAKEDIFKMIIQDRKENPGKRSSVVSPKQYYEALWETYESFVRDNPFGYLIKTINLAGISKRLFTDKESFTEEIGNEAMKLLYYHFDRHDFDNIAVPKALEQFKIECPQFLA